MRFLANRSELLPIARRCSQTIGTYFVSKEHACVLMEADAASNTVKMCIRDRYSSIEVTEHESPLHNVSTKTASALA